MTCDRFLREGIMTCVKATESALPTSCFNFAMSWFISFLRLIESQWLSTSAIRSSFKDQRASPWLLFVHFVVLFIRRRLADIWAEPKLNAEIMIASTFRSSNVAISRLILLSACFSQMQTMNSATNAKLYSCLIASENSLEDRVRIKPLFLQKACIILLTFAVCKVN